MLRNFLPRIRKLPAPLLLRAPRLVILNLDGAEGAPACTEDLRLLESLFAQANVVGPKALDDVERCDVLFVYSRLNEDGSMTDYPLSVTDLIGRIQPRVVVFSRDNDQDIIVAAAP